jgi:TPR repeat protein
MMVLLLLFVDKHVRYITLLQTILIFGYNDEKTIKRTKKCMCMSSCYTLATMLLRGDKVTKTADNVTPQEAQGLAPIQQRENEPIRSSAAVVTATDVTSTSSSDNKGKKTHNNPSVRDYTIPRDPKRAETLLKYACDVGSHVTSCHNLAVMYTHGDENVVADPELAELYKKKTQEKIHLFGGF